MNNSSRLYSKYSHNVIKTTTVGSKYGGKVPIENNVRRRPNVTNK